MQKCIKGADAWKAALSGFNYGGSHLEFIAACKLMRPCDDMKRPSLLLDILKSKTRIQSLAGKENFSSPQVMAQADDSEWDSHMRGVAKQPLSGMVWL